MEEKRSCSKCKNFGSFYDIIICKVTRSPLVEYSGCEHFESNDPERATFGFMPEKEKTARSGNSERPYKDVN